MRKNFGPRMAALALGAALLAGGSGVAFADEVDTEDVEVTFEILGGPEPGSLWMTVADDEVALTESGSGAGILQFTGTLPTVTVTDTRDLADIDPSAFWTVLGVASDFEGDGTQPDIDAENLGWAPALIDEGDTGTISEGGPVYPILDTANSPANTGLVSGADYLMMAWTSAELVEAGESAWTANAGLTVQVPDTTDPGTYTSTLTLTLTE
ncbi:MAG: hypothetical protein LBG60_09045 [Bifidobacteriaceae bacterium]|jgi:hypothetical protein|nr:hypothetical protein [Bifidobacteriaceae bacterium]